MAQLNARAQAKQDGQVLTPEEVAAILKVNPRTVVRQFESGKIAAVRVGNRWRCSRQALDKFLS